MNSSVSYVDSSMISLKKTKSSGDSLSMMSVNIIDKLSPFDNRKKNGDDCFKVKKKT